MSGGAKKSGFGHVVVLPRAFYDRDPRLVGPDLLGKVLIRREGRRTLAARIVEVEN